MSITPPSTARSAHYAQTMQDAIIIATKSRVDIGTYSYDAQEDTLSTVLTLPLGSIIHQIEEQLLTNFDEVCIAVRERGTHEVQVRGGSVLWNEFLTQQAAATRYTYTDEESSWRGFSIWSLIKTGTIFSLLIFLILVWYSLEDALHLQQAWQLDHQLGITATPRASFILQATWLRLVNLLYLM